MRFARQGHRSTASPGLEGHLERDDGKRRAPIFIAGATVRERSPGFATHVAKPFKIDDVIDIAADLVGGKAP